MKSIAEFSMTQWEKVLRALPQVTGMAQAEREPFVAKALNDPANAGNDPDLVAVGQLYNNWMVAALEHFLPEAISCHPSREGEEEVPQTKPKHEISILAEMSPKKKLEKQSCFPCMGNALKTSLVGFQPHGAEKSPLGALTLGSEPPQGGIFKGENGVHWRPKKKFVTKTMDEKHNENMFFVFTTIFDPLGLPHPLLKARCFGFFEIFFLDLRCAPASPRRASSAAGASSSSSAGTRAL